MSGLAAFRRGLLSHLAPQLIPELHPVDCPFCGKRDRVVTRINKQPGQARFRIDSHFVCCGGHVVYETPDGWPHYDVIERGIY